MLNVAYENAGRELRKENIFEFKYKTVLFTFQEEDRPWAVLPTRYVPE